MAEYLPSIDTTRSFGERPGAGKVQRGGDGRFSGLLKMVSIFATRGITWP
jgi:hypothetical protein